MSLPTTEISALDLLVRGRDRIANGWTQGSFERNVDGVTCYCAAGALGATEYDTPVKPYGEAVAAIERSISARGLRAITAWNDDPDRTQDEVLALFDAVIAVLAGAA